MNEKEKLQTQEEIDPYTGEKRPLAEDAGNIDELMPVDEGERSGKEYLLNEESSMDAIAVDNQADAIADKSKRFTEDENIEQLFDDRQGLASGGREALKDDLESHHALSPDISAGDLDADWQSANVSGEEAVGGSAPTPDQDVVDEIGEALGLTYDPYEPLQGEAKLHQRDKKRWELDPRSAQDQSDETEQDGS
jgi:hypothetical protein